MAPGRVLGSKRLRYAPTGNPGGGNRTRTQVDAARRGKRRRACSSGTRPERAHPRISSRRLRVTDGEQPWPRRRSRPPTIWDHALTARSARFEVSEGLAPAHGRPGAPIEKPRASVACRTVRPWLDSGRRRSPLWAGRPECVSERVLCLVAWQLASRQADKGPDQAGTYLPAGLTTWRDKGSRGIQGSPAYE